MKDVKRYAGIDQDTKGEMSSTAKIIRDAWVFGLIPESETCAGWTTQGIESLWIKVNAEWEKFGFLVSNLPSDLRDRFMRIQSQAVADARAAGWDPDHELQSDK